MSKMVRKCSMCGECKEKVEYRFMNKQNRYYVYCKSYEKLYNKEYLGKGRRKWN